ncbi:MAG: DUF2271 domain-containing protein [Myxococcales bacterium]|nr:DUF2271 domain-containing protein [Myxococcales bacterium]
MLVSIAASGCFAPTTGTDEGGPGAQPPGGLFGADGGVNVGCSNPDSSPLSTLRIRVRTTPFGGRYAPKNIGAIWIETSAGAFVKTVERWGKTRARYLTRFNASSGGNVVDAITSATLGAHTTHDRTWNLADKTACEIPAGDYKVVMEHTDRDGPGTSIELPWTKGTAPLTLTPAENTYFHDLLLELR